MNEAFHNYGPVILGIILSGVLAAVVGLYNRLERVSGRIHHKDYLEEKFTNLEERVKKLEKPE